MPIEATASVPVETDVEADEPFPRPVAVVGILSLAGDEVETVSMEVIQMWMQHFRARLGQDGRGAMPAPASAEGAEA